MQSSLDYAGFTQLCGSVPIMRKIMRTHNRIIPQSLIDSLGEALFLVKLLLDKNSTAVWGN